MNITKKNNLLKISIRNYSGFSNFKVRSVSQNLGDSFAYKVGSNIKNTKEFSVSDDLNDIINSSKLPDELIGALDDKAITEGGGSIDFFKVATNLTNKEFSVSDDLNNIISLAKSSDELIGALDDKAITEGGGSIDFFKVATNLTNIVKSIGALEEIHNNHKSFIECQIKVSESIISNIKKSNTEFEELCEITSNDLENIKANKDAWTKSKLKKSVLITTLFIGTGVLAFKFFKTTNYNNTSYENCNFYSGSNINSSSMPTSINHSHGPLKSSWSAEIDITSLTAKASRVTYYDDNSFFKLAFNFIKSIWLS